MTHSTVSAHSSLNIPLAPPVCKPTSIIPPPTVSGLTLGARNLSFRYSRKGDTILENINLDIEPGSVTALTGASGAGKSTLLYILALLLPATSGNVLWDGIRTESLKDGEKSQLRASRSGYVFQDAMLDPSRTVLDNVLESALFAGIDRDLAIAQARELLSELGLAHRIGHRPGEISGGQAQRVALCRALVTNPDVIFADEPTGNLDTESAKIVWDSLVAHAASGATVIIATHSHELAAAAGRNITIGLE